MSKLERNGMYIPKEIFEIRDINWGDKILLTEIYHLNKLEKGCFASNAHFAKLLGISPGTAHRKIDKLCESGYINKTCTDITMRDTTGSPSMIKQFLPLLLLASFTSSITAADQPLKWVKETGQADWQARDSQGELVYKDQLWLFAHHNLTWQKR